MPGREISLSAAEYLDREGLPLRLIRRDPEGEFPLHRHEFSELVVVFGGSGTHLAFGERHRLSPGDVFMIGEPGPPHGFADTDRLALYNVLFDRRKLAGLIFSDPGKKAAVEALVHPAVLADFRRWKRWHRPKGWTYGPVPFVVLESAIILSCPVFDGVGDKVVLVDADETVRAKRAADRDGSDLESALRRIRQQAFDRSRIDAVLNNGGTLEDLPAEVDRLFLNLFLSL